MRKRKWKWKPSTWLRILCQEEDEMKNKVIREDSFKINCERNAHEWMNKWFYFERILRWDVISIDILVFFSVELCFENIYTLFVW